MLHIILEWLQPAITLILEAAALTVFGIIARYIPMFARLYNDAKNRAALHSAIDTGVDLALATVEAGARAVPGVTAIETALVYVERSVPGALKRFFGDNATRARDHVRDMIVARLQAKTADPLAAALRDAGAPAVDVR